VRPFRQTRQAVARYGQMFMHSNPALDRPHPPIVLVVDDDLLVREPIADYLREVGYEVLEAGDAHEAIDVVDHADHVDLVFSDVRMPGELDGIGLARWVHAHRPNLPVLLTSGYDGNGWLRSELGREVRLLQKPYTQDQVLRHIKRLLSSDDTSPVPRESMARRAG
jgi:CheY-like chemotaxis protein